MRAQGKQVRHEEEEESAFVSMTDMTVGFLFIMMILLAFFASQARETDTIPRSDYIAVVDQRDRALETLLEREATITLLEQKIEDLEAQLADLRDKLKVVKEERDRLAEQVENLTAENAELLDRLQKSQKTVAKLEQEILEKDQEIKRLKERLARLERRDPLEAYLSNVAHERERIIKDLRDRLLVDFPDLKVELSEESDALRFQGEGLFRTGSDKIVESKRAIISRLAELLNEMLPCYTISKTPMERSNCRAGFIMIETVQIEGHTDNVGRDQTNRPLSANRANSTFFAMTDAANDIMQHLNLKRQPVLSVAAYGSDRPVSTNDTAEGRATNRRIDLRFIMVTPQDTDGIEVIRQALETVGGQE
ncbi:OmpA family protein [Donghicola sp.]|jgi:chemotaxis protein MotB|uniref:OmpA family protein n=1 Tax=Donghicola sp. TaxID=1929294 RepID=UPI0025DA6B50|nr:OmpA family protein [Donghicola sp.]MCT4579127.1 OmpA family protein [Donghicola sp.]